jgi:ribosomal protein L11 methyltransferase
VRLLDLYDGVEEVEGGYAVYAEEVPVGFDVAAVEDVVDGWEDAWRSFHRGLHAGPFWIGPPWETPPGDVPAIVIDPGRAFGTGAHATTRLSVELLAELPPAAMLDVGCGSGVLSIAGALRGFAPIAAVDVDPAAVEATEHNAAANGVSLDVRQLDALREPLPSVGVVVANVSLDVVQALLARVDARFAVTSGYYEHDLPRTDCYRQRERRVLNGWAADLFERAE